MKLDSDGSDENGIRDGGKEVSQEVAGTMEGFWKAWHLNLLSIQELQSTYSPPRSPPECSSPTSISVLVPSAKNDCPPATSGLGLGACFRSKKKKLAAHTHSSV